MRDFEDDAAYIELSRSVSGTTRVWVKRTSREQLVDTSTPTHAAAVKCVDQCMAPSRWLPKTSVVKSDKLLSQTGDAASCAFTALPASTDTRVPHEEYRVIWCFADSGYPFHWRRGVALAMAAWTQVGVLAQLARLNKRPPASAGIEVVANGSPVWQGAQIVVDATIFSPVCRDGHPKT